ncbi:protein FAR-RED ELONGATED HYPOCOTYL 1-like [Benincasa hispida]|uniref:protein FAR-RED ELONGATED HYPOCOTYL 1-like n=1 Tax=Benincasa hispida TaxID=102211 RepID=UPI0019028A3D|nr:protein FAR-RED ELONGATED HYPOCOTYL 1-like [Benincasa hispida]
MEEKEQNPTEINSFYVISKLRTNPFDLNKKRKLQAEHLGLPSAKHKHCSEGFPSKSAFLYGGLSETEHMDAQFIKGNANVLCFEEGSRLESVKDSNSLSEESDSATSVFHGGKFEPNQAITCTYDSSTTQSMSFGGASSESTHFSVESSTAMESSSTEQEAAFASGENRIESIHKLQEHLLELDSHEDYDCAEYGNDDFKQCTDQELEELLYSNGLNPDTYILSSGRWTVNHEAQSRARAPTIDEEFEQYFSMLML